MRKFPMQNTRDLDKIANRYLALSFIAGALNKIGYRGEDLPEDLLAQAESALKTLERIENTVGYELFTFYVRNEPTRIPSADSTTDPLDLTERAREILRDVESAIPF